MALRDRLAGRVLDALFVNAGITTRDQQTRIGDMFMRSFAARPERAARAMVVVAPGRVRTELGGPDGRLSIEETVPPLVEMLLAKRGRPGLEYLDYLGRTVPW